MIKQLIGTVFGITLLKKGPQDLPANIDTLKIIVGAMILVNVVSLSMVGALSSIVSSIFEMGVVAGGIYMLLSIKEMKPRFVQTISAIFGVNTLLSFMLLIFSFVIPEHTIAEDMNKLMNDMQGSDSAPQALSAFTYFFAGIGIWVFVVNAHIIKNAIGCSFPKGLLWALLLSFVVLFSAMLMAPVNV